MTDEELDSLIDDWHTMPLHDYLDLGSPTLHEYLGWSWSEYAKWVETNEQPRRDNV